ncbi:MAG: DUF3515 domain-containing protein [Micrococcaceae bacterium]
MAGITAVSLTACSGPLAFDTLAVEAAPDSNNPNCAKIMLAMPKKVSDFKQRETTSQGTTAYGDPSVLIVRCGLPAIQATSDPCVSVNDIDWISKQDTEKPDTWIFTSYGKSPTVEVLLDNTKISSSDALVIFSDIMEKMPSNGHKCLSVKDVSLNQ